LGLLSPLGPKGKDSKTSNRVVIGEKSSKLCAMKWSEKGDSRLEVAPTWNTGTYKEPTKNRGVFPLLRKLVSCVQKITGL